MKRYSKVVVFVALLLFGTQLFSCSFAEEIDISAFDATQYVTGEAETVDIYAGLSFGMFAEQAIVEARKANINITENPYNSSSFDVYTPDMVLVEEYYDAELHYLFDKNGEQLLQVRVDFNSPKDRIYNAIETILTEKYGETPYSSSSCHVIFSTCSPTK